MKVQQQNRRQAIKKQSTQDGFAAKKANLAKIFRKLDYWEQAEVMSDFARDHVDTIAECDRVDHAIMDQRRHEEALGRPWNEVRKELGIGQAQRKTARR